MFNVKVDTKTITRTWECLVRLYRFYKETSKELFHKLAEMAVAPRTKDPKANGMIEAAKRVLSDINNVNSLHLDYRGNFEADTEKCWKYMIKLRTASVCSMCSGNNAEFFWKNKGISTTDYCQKALMKCYRTLKVNGRLMKLVIWTIEADPELEKTGITIRQGKKGMYVQRQ